MKSWHSHTINSRQLRNSQKQRGQYAPAPNPVEYQLYYQISVHVDYRRSAGSLLGQQGVLFYRQQEYKG